MSNHQQDFSEITHTLINLQDQSTFDCEGGQLISQKSSPPLINTNEIPWLYKSPKSQLLQWKSLANAILSNHTLNIAKIEKELNENQLLSTTTTRLEKNIEALNHNKRSFKKLLSPLLTSNSDENIVHFAITDPVSSTQQIDSYYNNIFRDWVWGEKENNNYLNLLKAYINNEKDKNILILGCGAGRLAQDISANFQFKNIILTDINPFLLFTAQSLLSGESIDFYELPLNPLKVENYFKLHKCQSQQPTDQNINYIFADACHLPIKDNSIDYIITPWLIDIISDDFQYFSKRMNQKLKTLGQWINFGPLGYNHSQSYKNYSLEEIEEHLRVAKFDILNSEISETPYLQSPHSGHHRLEKIFSFSVQKIGIAKKPKDFNPLPSWLIDLNETIPQFSKLNEKRIKNQIQSEVLSIVNGQYSFNQIQQLMMSHYQMTEEQSQEALFTLLSTTHLNL